MNLSYRYRFSFVLLFTSALVFLLLTGISRGSQQPGNPLAKSQTALQSKSTPDKESQKTTSLPAPRNASPGKQYCGIAMDGCKLKTGVVKSGQTLAQLLNPLGISNAAIFQAAKISTPVFDVRRIKAGNTYGLISSPGNENQIKYFIYDLTPISYVVFAFDKPIRVYTGEKKLNIKTRTISGTITSNLWNAAKDSGLSDELIYALNDIFASTMDFRHLHQGDQFIITFEEKFIQNKCVGTGNIKAAELTCSNETFHAFAYKVNGNVGYYDEQGHSLEKSFLKYPLKYTRISSKFTRRRFDPILKKYLPHLGIDFAAPRGTPVRSVGDGTVIFKGYCKSAGNYIKIKHAGVGMSEYMHLSKFNARIKKNKTVKKGQIIGYVGSTGYATGPHLDLRFKKNGRYVDYTKMNLPTGKSLPLFDKEIFLKQVAKIKQQWENASRSSSNILAKAAGTKTNPENITPKE